MFYQREDAGTGHVSDLLEWGTMVAGPVPCVIHNKDNTLMTTLTYRGEDVAMLEPEARAVYLQRLNGVLMRLGSGWGLLFDQWHEATTAYPDSAWTNPTACFVDAARRALFTSGALYEDHQFLTLCWHPTHQTKARWYDQMFQTRALERVDTHTEELEAFVHAVTRWSDGLTGLFPAWHWLDPEETLTYLRRCVSSARERVRMPALPTDLAARLACEDFLPGHTPKLGTLFLRPLDIQQWPQGEPEEGGGLGMDVPLALQTLAFPYRFTVRYLPLDKDEAETALRDYQRKWANLVKEAWPAVVQFAFPGAAPAHTSSVGRALQSLLANEVHYGYATVTVLVWSETETELAHRERAAVKALQGAGLVVAKEQVNACQAWLGMQPGDLMHNVRQPLLPSLGVAFLLPHATVWAGEERDTHLDGPPLFTASSDGVPFRFVLHQGDVGHCLLVGPAGSGKSGKFGFMAMQAFRYPKAKIICFDKDLGLFVATMMAGGHHYHLGGPNSIGIQPFAQIERTEQERRWAWEWSVKLFDAEDLHPTPEEKEEIWIAIQRLAAFPHAMRTLSGFHDVLQVQRLKRGLTGFRVGGRYAFFDATQEDVTLPTPWTTYEMRALLDQPGALPHALRYKFHRIEQQFDGSPVFIFLDEVRDLLNDPVMGDEIMDWIKERRKFNVSVVLATQELIDVMQTKAWQAVLANCQTKVMLANKSAMNSDVMPYYKACGLTEHDIALIARGTPLQDYFYATSSGKRMYQVRLGEIDRLLCAASKQEEIAACHALVQQERTEPLVSAWLRANQYGQEADIFTNDYARKDSHDSASL